MTGEGAHRPPRSGRPEVVCLGESMSMLTAGPTQRLRDRPLLEMYVGGAESNVACGLAHLGHRVEWLSRVGDDPLGQGIVDFLASRHVGTEHVTWDLERRTGVYFKDSADQQTTVYYYRSGSAAAGMSREGLDARVLDDVPLLHLSGITPALSASCDDLMEALLVERSSGAGLISFDVNYRQALWPVDRAAPRLRELASAADVVVLGRDEAEALWGTRTPEEIHALFPAVSTLVVKDNDVGATCFSEGVVSFQPALKVRVVEPVGAGDAFAAGFLSGLLRGLQVDRCLRSGHVLAALTIQHLSDLPTLPAVEHIDAWAQYEGADWDQLNLDQASSTVSRNDVRESTP